MSMIKQNINIYYVWDRDIFTPLPPMKLNALFILARASCLTSQPPQRKYRHFSSRYGTRTDRCEKSGWSGHRTTELRFHMYIITSPPPTPQVLSDLVRRLRSLDSPGANLVAELIQEDQVFADLAIQIHFGDGMYESTINRHTMHKHAVFIAYESFTSLSTAACVRRNFPFSVVTYSGQRPTRPPARVARRRRKFASPHGDGHSRRARPALQTLRRRRQCRGRRRTALSY